MKYTGTGYPIYFVGEVFEVDGRYFRPVEDGDCNKCAFSASEFDGACATTACSKYPDRPSVIFVPATPEEAVAAKLTGATS